MGQGSAYTFLGFIYNPAVDSNGDVEASKYNLCYGMEGDYVKELQEALIKLGYSCGSAGAGTNNAVKGCITDKGVYTIVAEATDASGTKWGKLKSGAGWICLTYTTKL